MNTDNRMTPLLRRIADVGIPEEYIRNNVLPDWWDDEVAEKPAGYAEGLVWISRGTGLCVSSMMSERARPVFRVETAVQKETRIAAHREHMAR